MKSFEFTPASWRDWDRRVSSTSEHFARDWIAPLVAWVVVSGMGLALVSVLLAPAE